MTISNVRFVAKNGLDNNSNSITNLGTLGASLTLSGANALTVTTTGATNVTFPTSGILATTSSNVATATALATPRAINGVNFDGTAPITVASAAGTLTGTTLASNVVSSSLTSVGTLTNLIVTNPITGSVTGSSGSTTGNAATATALATARDISVSGDAAWTVSFDGSVNATAALTLATVNASPVTASFQKVTTNSKGLVTATSAVVSSDITTALAFTPVNKAGDTMTGALILSADPVAALGAVTKQYVDNVQSGVTIHQPCDTATTVALSTCTYSNGVAGVGATLTATANGALGTIGGYAGLIVGSRILVKNQASGLQNGVYTVTDLGSAGTPWILTRAADFDGSPTYEVVSGDLTYIQNGTTGGTQWVQTAIGTGVSTSPAYNYVIIGTDALVFGQFAGSGTYSAGTGIGIATNVISNTGVLSNIAGTGISVSGATGNVTVTNTGVTSIAGTTNQITASASTGGITLSLPQNINSGAAPTFAGTNFTSIPNGALANSSVTVNGTDIALGASGTVTAAAGTLTGTTLASNVVSSSLTSVGTLSSLTVTAPITGSVTGSSGSTTGNAATATNASQLLGKTWASPDPIGGTTPSTGAFTQVLATSDTQTGYGSAALEARSNSGNVYVSLHAAGVSAAAIRHVRSGSGVEVVDAADALANFVAAAGTFTTLSATGTVAGSNLSGTNTGDNATNSQYASDYRAANFVAGTHYLAPNGSAAALTNFPALNQNTTGNAATATTATRSDGLTVFDNDRNANTILPNLSPHLVRMDFVNSSTTDTGGTYAGVMTVVPYDGNTASTGGPSYQVAYGTYGSVPQLNVRQGIDTSWSSWYRLLHTGNFLSGTDYLAPGSALTNCTVDGVNAIGFRGMPQNSQSAAYTVALVDAGKHILHPASDTTARSFVIPANSSVAFPLGSAITFINQNGAGVISISINSDIMRLAGAGTTGTRTLAANGVATAVKITVSEWIISGVGLT